ncbi:DUF1642 domain-containing protein [Enterococcus hirae]|uniref:DUF1642 domain-containing protein n=1 Tax=Enterococcus hirae TaxID=1354 RepID=UPI000E1B11E3|nr:DUF1642 domain-containing protein [Enterococcus hirae]RBT57512.1 hypothetical protein EB39_02899 [Enterococcus hirae]
MNKQKLIDKYTAEISRLRPYCPNRNRKEEQFKSTIYTNIIDDLNQLDEQQKPVVDSFVAEWFEDNKDALDLAIFIAIRELDDEEWPHKTDFENWLDVAENKPIETLFRMKGGYEVKNEPLYRVKLGEGYFVEYQGRGALIMIIPDDNKEIKIFDSKSDAERTAQTIGGTVEEVAEG